ncbi:hypothetical protein LPTSP4_34080 [Leptospira ryugenii]|uniref:DUF5683 domain-containing protein n=1 Tax=Leptospira ryugenii TaxID=1917863 RepID=A0A2P2E4Q5_9LEPT|nr:DUF5683 domain-containing protein [Leptospira ryugenii]GBF51870.1 hypothetical protein LPTSP4_34080 [Leptospira ryugenii]
MKSVLRTHIHTPLLFVLLLSVPMFAENVLLKRGGTVKGKIIEQDQNKLKIQKEDGTVATISKSEILKVVYKEHITAAEEEKLRKAEEEKARLQQEKERQKEEERQKKELAEKEKADKENADKKAKEDAEAKKKREAEEKLAQESRKNLTRGGAVWRSAVLPGWGQYRQGRKVVAFVYPTLIAVGLFFTYEENRYYLNAKRDYNNLDNPYTETGYIRAILGAGPVVSAVPADPLFAYTANEISPFKGQRESVEKHYRQMQYIGGATALLYAWNVLDAFLFHPKQSVADLQVPEEKDRFYVKTTMDQLDAVPFSSFFERRFETKTNVGYQFVF